MVITSQNPTWMFQSWKEGDWIILFFSYLFWRCDGIVMDSTNDKQLCKIYESNSSRMTLPCFNWKIFGFTKNSRLWDLLSPSHIRCLNTVSQHFIVKYNIWTTEIAELVDSLLDPLVTSPSLTLLFGRWGCTKNYFDCLICWICYLGQDLWEQLHSSFTHSLTFLNNWQWTCRQSIIFGLQEITEKTNWFEPVKPVNSIQQY